jgi:hypothetical protein
MARQAYKDREYVKATELAWAADSWTHVGDHLNRINNPNADRRSGNGSMRAPTGEEIPPPPSLDQMRPPTTRPPADR